MQSLGYHQHKSRGLAEGVGFEPTEACDLSGFQDRCNKPLYHSSVCDFAFFKDCKSKRNFHSCKTPSDFVLLVAEIRKRLFQIFVIVIFVAGLAGIQL